MKKERNLYIDVLKAFSIILVVLGHCVQYGAGKEYSDYGLFFANPVFIFIYSFHMPLFMLISGFLFAYSVKNRSWLNVLITKGKQLLIPLAGWSVVSTLISIIKIICGVSTRKFSFIWLCQSLYSGFWGGPWFLWAMWWGIVAVVLVRTLLRDNPFAYLLLTAATFFIPDTICPAVYKFMLPFFILAYYFNAHGISVKFKKVYMNPIFIVGCALTFTALIHLFNYDTYIYTSGFYIFAYPGNAVWQIHNNVLRFVIGLFGSISFAYLVYALVKILPEIINRPLAFLGRTTLGVYIISGYIFTEVLIRIPIKELNYGYIILETVAIMAVSVIITLLIQKFKYANRLLLGGR